MDAKYSKTLSIASRTSGPHLTYLQSMYTPLIHHRLLIAFYHRVEDKIYLRYPPYTEHAFEVECAPGLTVQIPESTPEEGLVR